jgi:hypothetical protein
MKEHWKSALKLFLVSTALGLLVLTVLSQSNPAHTIPKTDYGAFAYIGRIILQGKLPYLDAWDNKPPAIYYLNALGLWLGHNTRWGIFAIQLFMLYAASQLSFWLIDYLWGDFPAWVGTLAWLYGLNITLKGGNLTEEYPLALHFLALTLLVFQINHPAKKMYTIFLGLCMGISILFRPNNAIVEGSALLALILVKLINNKKGDILKTLLSAGIGVIVPLGLFAVYFYWKGILFQFLEGAFIYNLAYASTRVSDSSPIQGGLGYYGIIFWMSLAGYLVLLIWLIFHLFSTAQSGVLYALLIGWPLAIFFVDPSGRNYEHYYINWLPFLGLLIGLAFAPVQIILKKLISWNFNRLLRGLVWLGVVTFFVKFGYAAEYKASLIVLQDPEHRELKTRIATYVTNHSKPADFVLFWGPNPAENFMSNRESPSPYLFYPFYVPSDLTNKYSEQFFIDLKTNRPILIVDMNDKDNLSIDPQKRKQQIVLSSSREYLAPNISVVLSYIDENYCLNARIGDNYVYRLCNAP